MAAEAEVRAAEARLRGARLDADADWRAAAARRDAAASREAERTRIAPRRGAISAAARA